MFGHVVDDVDWATVREKKKNALSQTAKQILRKTDRSTKAKGKRTRRTNWTTKTGQQRAAD